MDSQKEHLVKLLQEEVSSLRSEGKRVAAEAVERVLAKFEGKHLSWLDEVSPGAERVASPVCFGGGFYISPCIDPITLTSPGGAIPDPEPPASRFPSIIGEFRDKLLSVKSSSFRITSFHLSQRQIRADGVSREHDGAGEADILDPSDEGRRTAVADLLAALPPPPQGFNREKLEVETSPFGMRPVLGFRFRDVEVTEEVKETPSACPPPDHPDFSAWKQALVWWRTILSSMQTDGLSRPNSDQSGSEFARELTDSLVKHGEALVWKVPNMAGGIFEVRVLPITCMIPGPPSHPHAPDGYYRTVLFTRDKDGKSQTHAPWLRDGMVFPAGQVERIKRES